MRDAKDVIAEVVNGKGPELARVLEVSVSRCYEILSKDSPYPKAKRLIRAIAQVNPSGVALIKADLMAMFDQLLADADEPPVAEIFKETNEAIQSVLDDAPTSTQCNELREAISVMQTKLEKLERHEADELQRFRQRDAFKGQPVSHHVREQGKKIVRTAQRG